MKQRSTTPVSTGFAARAVLVASAVLMAIAAPLSTTNRAHADQWDSQIGALQGQIDQFQAQANQLSQKAATLQEALNNITAQKNAILAQIALSQQQYDQLQQQIKDTEKKIVANKDALGDTIADMSIDDSISPLEMLASSKNIGDFVDKQEYRSSIRDSLTSTITEIQNLKKKLEASKEKVQEVLAQQQSQKADLAAKEAEQARLVEQTKGEEASYQQLANDSRAQLENAAAQQRAYYASMRAQSGGSFDSGVVGSFVYSNWSGNMGCGGGGYPYCAGPLDYNYPNGSEYGLFYRECVDYAAYRIDHTYGKRVQPFGGYGMAYQWAQGYAKGAWRVTDPQPGDAVVLPISGAFAPVGHLMVVEGVSGGTVHVSQYNFLGTGEYSTMDIQKSGVVFLRFPSK